MSVRVLGSRQNDIDALAAEWVIRLGAGPLPEGERRRLDRWLGENAGHTAAFDRALSVWADLGALQTAPGALAEDFGSPGQRATAFYPHRRAMMLRAAAVIALAVVGAGLGAFWFGNPLLMLEADYRTAPGESRTLTLADGSVVQLATDTALAVRFDRRERRVDLLSGEAYFTVAPIAGTETRPFVVKAANGVAKALGTQFMVDREGDGAAVTVAEHRVQVSALSAADDEPRSVVLSPGQSIRYDRTSGIETVTPVDLDQATAWRRGRLIFDKVPLAAVVAELNRYRRGRIVIADAALADRRVSGVFETADLTGALVSITRELGVRTATLLPFVTILY